MDNNFNNFDDYNNSDSGEWNQEENSNKYNPYTSKKSIPMEEKVCYTIPLLERKSQESRILIFRFRLSWHIVLLLSCDEQHTQRSGPAVAGNHASGTGGKNLAEII